MRAKHHHFIRAAALHNPSNLSGSVTCKTKLLGPTLIPLPHSDKAIVHKDDLEAEKHNMHTIIHCYHNLKFAGTSLVVQWLRLSTSNTGDLDFDPCQGTRSHMTQLRVHRPQ